MRLHSLTASHWRGKPGAAYLHSPSTHTMLSQLACVCVAYPAQAALYHLIKALQNASPELRIGIASRTDGGVPLTHTEVRTLKPLEPQAATELLSKCCGNEKENISEKAISTIAIDKCGNNPWLLETVGCALSRGVTNVQV